MARTALLLILALAASCVSSAPRSSILVADLHAGEDSPSFRRIRAAFRATNPGYDVRYAGAVREVEAGTNDRVAFVQGGETTAKVWESTAQSESALAVGDLVLLRAGESLQASSELDLLLFELPDALSAELPTFVRPDWDPRITDQPGGCATETGAYRRILLTWSPENGPYLSHSLNAHRVRITDSFTHYHPVDGGFDEFYLVQMVQPDARILTTDEVEALENRTLTRESAADLFDVTPLSVGDLVYLPRGTIHRGLGGVLAQVIAAPGFRPGTEIGVDEHLRALNAGLGLVGNEALPHHR